MNGKRAQTKQTNVSNLLLFNEVTLAKVFRTLTWTKFFGYFSKF